MVPYHVWCITIIVPYCGLVRSAHHKLVCLHGMPAIPHLTVTHWPNVVCGLPAVTKAPSHIHSLSCPVLLSRSTCSVAVWQKQDRTIMTGSKHVSSIYYAAAQSRLYPIAVGRCASATLDHCCTSSSKHVWCMSYWSDPREKKSSGR